MPVCDSGWFHHLNLDLAAHGLAGLNSWWLRG